MEDGASLLTDGLHGAILADFATKLSRLLGHDLGDRAASGAHGSDCLRLVVQSVVL